MTYNSNNNDGVVNYPLLAVNAGVNDFNIHFLCSSPRVPASTIFAIETKRCSFGFNLFAQDAQIAVAMVGGILILPFFNFFYIHYFYP